MMHARTSIGILPLPEPGHFNATVSLARELLRAGHTVHFLGDPSDAALLASQDVPFAPLARIETPFGATHEWGPNRDELVLVDGILTRSAVDACNAGKRVVMLSTTFPLGYDEDIPPVVSGLAPATDDASRAQIRAAWETEWGWHRKIQNPHPQVGRADSTLNIMRSFMRDRGWSDAQWDERAVINPIPRIPELVMAPEQLDFPRRASPLRRYAGPCVNIDRIEPELPLACGADERPLVYVSFGSQTHEYALADLLAILVRAIRELPEVRFVVATGIVELPPEALPPNAVAVRFAPQIAALRRAALMIAHGGLNGVKEALFCGVPLLVLPLVGDQPGNAARIAAHRLGNVARWDGMTPAQLAALVRTSLADAELAQRVRSFGERLRSDHERGAAASALAALLDEPR